MQTKILLFYIFLSLFHILLSTVVIYISGSKLNIKSSLTLMITTILLISFVLIYTNNTDIFRDEGFNFQVSPGKLCQGGSYLHQGDSPEAKMCQELMKTNKGQSEINRYNCGKGYVGMPGKNFTFTPDSNSNWENERCVGKQTNNNNKIF